MIKILFLIPFLILGLSGCGEEPKPCVPEVLTNTVYIKQKVPKLSPIPRGRKYTVKQVQINGVDYFIQTKKSASIMATNWTSYKSWAVTNYKILKGLK